MKEREVQPLFLPVSESECNDATFDFEIYKTMNRIDYLLKNEITYGTKN